MYNSDIAKLRKDKVIGVLDLRSVGYFKVSYQKMITMAESRQTFKMYHHQQVRKEPKNILVSTIGCQIQTQRRNTLNLLIALAMTNTLG